MGLEPYIILKNNETRDNGEITYQVEGLCVEYLRLFAEKFNFKIIYNEPVLTMDTYKWDKKSFQEDDMGGISHVLADPFPTMVGNSKKNKTTYL